MDLYFFSSCASCHVSWLPSVSMFCRAPSPRPSSSYDLLRTCDSPRKDTFCPLPPFRLNFAGFCSHLHWQELLSRHLSPERAQLADRQLSVLIKRNRTHTVLLYHHHYCFNTFATDTPPLVSTPFTEASNVEKKKKKALLKLMFVVVLYIILAFTVNLTYLWSHF